MEQMTNKILKTGRGLRINIRAKKATFLKKLSFVDRERNLLSKALQALSRVTFSAPKKNKVVIFDVSNCDMLKSMILDDIPHTVLPAAYEIFYVRPIIILYFIKNLFLVFLPHKKYRSLYLLYLLSCIEFIKPKIVISYLEYHYIFHAIGEIYTHADFYAIQNGVVCADVVRDWLPAPPKMGSVWNMQNFLCFGKYYIDLYRKHGHSAQKFHPVGSLKGGFYKSKLCPGQIPKEFQICLISQWRESVEFQDIRTIVDMLGVLCDFTNRYIEKHKVSLCIATVSKNQKEKDFFRRFFSSDVTIIENDYHRFSSYFAVDKSNVALTLTSTLGFEAFGWGQKVLFCNLPGKAIWDFPFDGLWSLNLQDYAEFENKLSFLLKLSDSEYKRLSEEAAREVMNYDFSMPPHDYMRKIVLEQLAS